MNQVKKNLMVAFVASAVFLLANTFAFASDYQQQQKRTDSQEGRSSDQQSQSNPSSQRQSEEGMRGQGSSMEQQKSQKQEDERKRGQGSSGY